MEVLDNVFTKYIADEIMEKIEQIDKDVKHFYTNFVINQLLNIHLLCHKKFSKTIGAMNEISKIKYDIVMDSFKLTSLNNNDKLTVTFIKPYHYYNHDKNVGYTTKKGIFLLHLKDEPIHISKWKNMIKIHPNMN